VARADSRGSGACSSGARRRQRRAPAHPTAAPARFAAVTVVESCPAFRVRFALHRAGQTLLFTRESAACTPVYSVDWEPRHRAHPDAESWHSLYPEP